MQNLSLHCPATCVCGLDICTCDLGSALRSVLPFLLQEKRKSPLLVFTPNAEMLGAAKQDPELHRLLKKGDLLLPDGIGTCIAARMVGSSIPHRIPGITFAEGLLAEGNRHELSLFLLGGKEGVAEKAAKRITEKYPHIAICGCHHGYFPEESDEESTLVQEIATKRPDLLFVCMGFPRQEKFILRNAPPLSGVGLMIGLGGAMDVFAGIVDRAPALMQKLGLEWLYRVAREPSRIPRLPKSLRGILP